MLPLKDCGLGRKLCPVVSNDSKRGFKGGEEECVFSGPYERLFWASSGQLNGQADDEHTDHIMRAALITLCIGQYLRVCCVVCCTFLALPLPLC